MLKRNFIFKFFSSNCHQKMEKIIVETPSNVVSRLATEIEKCANNAIIKNDVFRIGLSGGSLVNYLSTGLSTINTDWTKWRLFFCDERFVPESDDDSTFGAYKKLLIPKTPLKESQFVQINIKLSLDDCAKDYQEKILKEFSISDQTTVPRFDLLLLGMGPDGHTCSLFPEHSLLKENMKLIASINDSPKPPPQRVTMTFPLINNAHCCIFAMAGAGKSDMVKRVFIDKENLPAAMVLPKNGILKCIFDKEAAIYFS